MNNELRNEIKMISQNRKNVSWVNNLLRQTTPFSYERKMFPSYDLVDCTGLTIALIIKHCCETFAVEIAQKIIDHDKITEKQRWAMANQFAEMEITFGQVKESLIAYWGEDYVNNGETEI